MLAEYTGVLVIVGISFVLAAALLGFHLLVGPRRHFPEKQQPFECGQEQISSPKARYAVKFYLVAILFVVFDIEAIYFYPWGATFRETGLAGLLAITVFAIPLVVGLAYEWMKGGLEW
jgi:NADH-quinone oxidoreductase subunit A